MLPVHQGVPCSRCLAGTSGAALSTHVQLCGCVLPTCAGVSLGEELLGLRVTVTQGELPDSCMAAHVGSHSQAQGSLLRARQHCCLSVTRGAFAVHVPMTSPGRPLCLLVKTHLRKLPLTPLPVSSSCNY